MKTAHPTDWHPEAEPVRLLALSDGIFSVAMTLAAVQVLPPDLSHRLYHEGAAAVLSDLWPQFLSVAVTFMIVGFYWITHHRHFSYIKRTDRGFLSLNMLFLLLVTLMPFFVQLSSVPREDRVATVSYGLYVGALGLVMNLIWYKATHKRRLVDHDLPERIVRYNHYRSAFSAGVFLLSCPLAWYWDSRMTRFVWCLLFFNHRASAWLASRD